MSFWRKIHKGIVWTEKKHPLWMVSPPPGPGQPFTDCAALRGIEAIPISNHFVYLLLKGDKSIPASLCLLTIVMVAIKPGFSRYAIWQLPILRFAPGIIFPSRFIQE